MQRRQKLCHKPTTEGCVRKPHLPSPTAPGIQPVAGPKDPGDRHVRAKATVPVGSWYINQGAGKSYFRELSAHPQSQEK